MDSNIEDDLRGIFRGIPIFSVINSMCDDHICICNTTSHPPDGGISFPLARVFGSHPCPNVGVYLPVGGVRLLIQYRISGWIHVITRELGLGVKHSFWKAFPVWKRYNVLKESSPSVLGSPLECGQYPGQMSEPPQLWQLYFKSQNERDNVQACWTPLSSGNKFDFVLEFLLGLNKDNLLKYPKVLCRQVLSKCKTHKWTGEPCLVDWLPTTHCCKIPSGIHSKSNNNERTSRFSHKTLM